MNVRGDILSSHDENQIHVHNHARAHSVLRVCDHRAFLCHKYAQVSFF